MTGPEPRIEGRGLAVGKCSIRPGQSRLLDLHYLTDTHARTDRTVCHRTFSSDGQEIAFPGRYRLTEVGSTTEIVLDVTRAGAHAFSVKVETAQGVAALGYGLTDPDDTRSLMVSWWTGDVEPYGIVKYAIRDARTIEGYYISKMSPDQPGAGIAIGDTTQGFAGDFVLNSREVNGRTWGPHDWSLRQRGDAVDLVWRENGKVFCLGLGMIDPADPDAVLANYIPV